MSVYTPDVVSLRQFYASALGGNAQRMIAAAIHELWPQAKGDAVLGIGFCAPYLEGFVDHASPVALCMPAQQGAAYWPPSRANTAFLGHESELPVRDNSINRILLVHSVENSEHLTWMMEEIWRVLTPGGRVLAVVPNRMGFWSRASRSPFAHGRPFSMAQLRDLMTGHQFTPTRSGSALFMPPARMRVWWRMADVVETAGKWLWPFFGGVLLLEAEKQLYAAIRQPVMARKGYRMPIPAVQPALGMKDKVPR